MTQPFTKATMRRDIAEAVGIDPSEIGGDDKLLDLGLDSMRALTLLLRWGERGVSLQFAELAERPTLDGWWSLAQSRVPTSAVS